MAFFDKNKLGELRPNQIITTFGPGSVVDAVKDSVTVLDISYWKEKGQKRAPRRDAWTALLLSEIFFIDIKKAAGCHLVIMDQGNGFP